MKLNKSKKFKENKQKILLKVAKIKSSKPKIISKE